MTVEIRGIDELRRKLGEWQKTVVLDEPMRKSLDQIKADAGGYTQYSPPKPAGSTYERTHILGKSILSAENRITHRPDGVIGTTGTKLEHAPFVLDARYQLPIHRGRWYTIQSLFERRKNEIVRIFQKAIDGALR